MKLTQFFDFSDNPVFKSVTGLLNKTWDASNITSGQAATEDQVKAAVEGIGSTEHYLVSTDSNIIITTQGTAGVEDVFLASRYGENNHVAGFVSGEDKIRVPLDVIKEFYPSTTLVVGPLPAEKFVTGTPTGDELFYSTEGGDDYRLLFVKDTESASGSIALLTLDGATPPTLTAADIEIV